MYILRIYLTYMKKYIKLFKKEMEMYCKIICFKLKKLYTYLTHVYKYSFVY